MSDDFPLALMEKEIMLRPWKWILCALTLPSSVIASGQLDPEFGDNGTLAIQADLIAPSGDEAVFDGLVDHVGRYVSFGTAEYKPEGYFYNNEDFVGKVGMITRHLPDGALDSTFGKNGIAYQQVSSFFLEWKVALELPDGKLLVAGNQTDLYGPPGDPGLICRLDENGELDKTFALNGCRWLDFLLVENIHTVVDMDVGADGRIFVLGASYGPTAFAVARMHADGSDDRCFGDAGCSSGGLVRGPEKLADIDVKGMIVQPSGGIVIAGNREDKDDPNDPLEIEITYKAVAFRLLPSGKHDATFGTDGIREFDASGFFPGKIIDERIYQIVSDHDGGFVVAGYVEPQEGGLPSAALVGRMTAAGKLDSDFASGGIGLYHYDEAAAYNGANAVSVQPDGKLAIVGLSAYEDYSDDMGVMRLLADGTLDKHFGSNGVTTLATPPGMLWNYATAIDASRDRIVIFGNSAMEVQDGTPTITVLDRDNLFGDTFE